MAYCTLSDIEKRLPEADLLELTDDDGAGVVDEDKVDAAIADADEEIDAFLSVRYGLPFTTTPALVARFSATLAICNLYGRRTHLVLPEQLSDRCKETRRMLEQIAKGAIRLDVPDPATDSDAGVGVTTARDDRVFFIGRDSSGTTGSLDNY